MRKLLCIAGLSLALGHMSPAQEPVVLEVDDAMLVTGDSEEAQVIGNEFLKATSEMWLLLSGISSREDADKAAARFTELVELTFELDNRLSALPLVAQGGECVGMMDAVQLRILEALDDLHAEFQGICRARCYGSARLTKAFENAVELGLFAEADAEVLSLPTEPLSVDEGEVEMARLARLVEPDSAVLDILVDVQNEKDATLAVPQLDTLSRRYRMLLPASSVIHRDFSPIHKSAAQAIMAPIEPILWAIRSEIVRIAALPGYEAETFDLFSDALDLVFECMSAAHPSLFDSVFDASFRADLDNALRENAISSQ